MGQCFTKSINQSLEIYETIHDKAQSIDAFLEKVKRIWNAYEKYSQDTKYYADRVFSPVQVMQIPESEVRNLSWEFLTKLSLDDAVKYVTNLWTFYRSYSQETQVFLDNLFTIIKS